MFSCFDIGILSCISWSSPMTFVDNGSISRYKPLSALVSFYLISHFSFSFFRIPFVFTLLEDINQSQHNDIIESTS